ncbi:hypothetical protein [Hahella ganghwensis]|uniref:hypothetical protein n=1 Tax=Hahella ganghwensis TaxID=286420 RepID=UPI0003690FB7|nr:hypothetical protein [Hahella ganghwensis]
MNISILFANEGLTTSVMVRELPDGFFKLMEHPIFSESAKYGDVVELTRTKSDKYEFVRVVESSEYLMEDFVLPLEIAESNKLTSILDKLTNSGGFWQRDFGGWLVVFYLANKYDPRRDIKSIYNHTQQKEMCETRTLFCARCYV